jgi:hypothetical protein
MFLRSRSAFYALLLLIVALIATVVVLFLKAGLDKADKYASVFGVIVAVVVAVTPSLRALWNRARRTRSTAAPVTPQTIHHGNPAATETPVVDNRGQGVSFIGERIDESLQLRIWGSAIMAGIGLSCIGMEAQAYKPDPAIRYQGIFWLAISVVVGVPAVISGYLKGRYRVDFGPAGVVLWLGHAAIPFRWSDFERIERRSPPASPRSVLLAIPRPRSGLLMQPPYASMYQADYGAILICDLAIAGIAEHSVDEALALFRPE